MKEFHPYFTSDGSVGLFSTEYNDIFHSATGALTEAYEKFIYPVDFDSLMKEKQIDVLDICYGIGYNSKSFLNFIFEKYLKKNFQKKHFHAKKNIVSIHTDKNNSKVSEIYNDQIYTNNKTTENSSVYTYQIYTNNNSVGGLSICNDEIYTNNIFPKFSITAIDNDKFLSFLSPFVKTGEKHIKNNKLDFQYKNIDKYLKNSKNQKKPKIENFINFLIFEKLAQKYEDFLNNDDINEILINPSERIFFDKNMRGIYQLYSSSRGNCEANKRNLSFLHNIYYHHISNCYKNGLKTYLLCDIDFELKIDDARNFIKSDNKMYNLIFLDAFTPSKCPCLWSYEFFLELFNHLKSNGMILTYSSSASIRSAMIEAGFYIGNIYNERENKFIGTVGVKNYELIKHPLSEYDLGLLKTTAGIFYRDKNLIGQNEAIIAARNFEVRNSTRISSSKYKKKLNM